MKMVIMANWIVGGDFVSHLKILYRKGENILVKSYSIRKRVIWRYYTEIGKVFMENRIVCATYVYLYMNVNLFSYTRVCACIGVPKNKLTYSEKLTFINIS